MKYGAVDLPDLMAALEADPADRYNWLAYIDALLLADQIEAARQVLELARRQGLQGNDVDALVRKLSDEVLPYDLPAQPSSLMPASHEVDKLANLFVQGRYPEAESLAKAMVDAYPAHGFGYKVLGAIYKQMGNDEQALTFMQKAAMLIPEDAAAHSNLGLVLNDLGRLEEALASCRRALRIYPDFAEGHNNLGITLHSLGRLFEAEASYRSAIHCNPDYAPAYNNLGRTLQQMGRPEVAEINYRQALKINPDYADALSNLASNLLGTGHLLDAEINCRKAISIKPDCADAYVNLAAILLDSGRIEDAEANLRAALLLKPDHAMAHSNLIFILDMKTGMDTAALRDERRRWDVAHAVHLRQKQGHANTPDPERKLRIGYVSADFRMHSAAFVFGAMLVNFDRDQFDVIAYSNFTKEDFITQTFRQSVTTWRNIASLTDDAVADTMIKDEVDILVDLSGHSSGNRLLVFARKPAPIQITAWGYAHGTGMSAMDVFFTDPVSVPPEEKVFYAEQVRYLPCVVNYFNHHAAPGINELPGLSGKGITFGSFNRLVKNSDETYAAWAEILKGCADSRMIIKVAALDDASAREQVQTHFMRAGIAPERIILQGSTDRDAHMTAYNQIDIALDPFPHGGGVTALEGLMMGVPMVTLNWPTTAGRVSASIMTALGLTDWIAESQAQYVGIALEKAADLQSLSELRRQLRGIFTSSIVGDQAAYVRAVEQEYRTLWREWCRSPKKAC